MTPTLINEAASTADESPRSPFSVLKEGGAGVISELNDLEKSNLLYNTLKWASHEKGEPLSYIVGYQHEDLHHCAPKVNFRTGSLSEQNLPTWLRQDDIFGSSALESSFGKCTGGFRVLFCERSLGNPPILECSRSSIISVLQHFDLAPETIPSVVQLLGAFGKHVVTKTQGTHVHIVIKAFQKGELGNWSLSLKHDYETSWTDALVVWTGWTSLEHRAMDGQYKTRLTHVIAQLQAVPRLWSHPTCLPLIFMQNYIGRSMERCNMINQELVHLDVDLGVNQAGRLIKMTGLEEDWPANLDFEKLTIGLHSVNNQLAFVQQAAKWARRCLEFLIDIEGDFETTNLRSTSLCASIRESLSYQVSVIRGIEDSFDALKTRAQGATSVLFNASSQNDSMLNVKIAASSKEDSISMKTFTFLTALFLPGTYIAALLSVTTIDWLPGSDESPAGEAQSPGHRTSVSRYYWLYWVLTIPITILVMFGWYLWYRHANRRWLKQAGLPRMSR